MHLPIIDGRQHFGAGLDDVYRHPDSPQGRLARRAGVRVPPITAVAQLPPLLARLNHNRWIADCPDCRGAEYVWPDQLLFLCCNCWNAAVGGQWRQVALPVNRAYIERILLARPLPASRNWDPVDSPAKLRAENRAHGLPDWVVL